MGKSAEELGVLRREIRSGLIMIEKLGAGAEKLFPRLHPANGVFEFWDVSLRDVDQVFLHLLDMLGFDKVRDFPGRFLVK